LLIENYLNWLNPSRSSKNIKIDKITVWDSGNNGDNGAGSTANFVSGMMKTVPPLNDLFNMAGLNLPTYLKVKIK
jgi:flotillin